MLHVDALARALRRAIGADITAAQASLRERADVNAALAREALAALAGQCL